MPGIVFKPIPALSDKDLRRFWSNVALPNEDGCMLWAGARGRKGYARTRLNNQGKFHVHRIAYELAFGNIPDGLTIDHLCRVTNCVAPDHLEAVTNKENSLRGTNMAVRNAAKSECPQGHLYAGTNLITDHRGFRWCRECKNRHNRTYRLRKKVMRDCA